MAITKLDISCIWGGTLAGILLRNESALTRKIGDTMTKIIGIHGWLDNLNSLLPLAKQLVDRNPNYEIYLYDRAGHGFSSHIPKGFDYSQAHNLQDIRTIIQIQGSRIDKSLEFHKKPARNFELNLTFEKAVELTRVTREGITDEAARLLTERSIRLDTKNKIQFTRDEALKIPSLIPFTAEMSKNAIEHMKASILFIGATNPQWPRAGQTLDYLKEKNPNFETMFIDGPHHFHMTHVQEVTERIEQYFNKYIPRSSTSIPTDS
ncbi:hypothetical protein I4U23_002415 [Adineta vaga]|nr:hypothetical protein I4U23_002415 [Adineta vaga]